MDKNLNNNDIETWVDDRLAELRAPSGWEPNAARAFESLLQRSSATGGRQRRRAMWVWFAVPALAGSLALLGLSSVWFGTDLSGPGGGPSEGPIEEPLVAFAEVSPAAVFQGDDTLLRPKGYREWVFVGSSLGLSYAEVSEEMQAHGDDLFHNVYIDPVGYTEFSDTGKFPNGTVMVMELATAEVMSEPNLEGTYEKDFVALEASVKDVDRFGGDWAYFSFAEEGGELKDRAEPLDPEFCWNCHDQNAESDMVFTQFYPVLRSARSE